MEKLKKAYKKLLELLGLAKPPPPPPPPPTKLQTILEKYKIVAESEKNQFIDTTIKEALTMVSDTEKAVASQSQDVILNTSSLYNQVTKGLENIDVAYHFLVERGKLQKATSDSPETEDELSVLQSISKLLRSLAIPGKFWDQKFESYVQQFEEQLLMVEARGEYKFKISENKEWIKLPLLQYLKGKNAGKEIARKELLQFFYDCPQVGLIELDAKVPMLPTSLIDVKMMIDNKRVTPVYLKEKEEWFLLIVN